MSKLIVSALRSANPPSRFLRRREEEDTQCWEDVGDKRAAEKVSQTLREKDSDEKAEYLARIKSTTQSMETHEHIANEAVIPPPISHAAAAHAVAHAVPEEEMVQVQLPSPEKTEEIEI